MTYPSDPMTPRLPWLREATTLRVGGPVSAWAEAGAEWALVGAVRAADHDRRPVLVLGAGSNLFASDSPFDGVVVRDGRRGARAQARTAADPRGGATVDVTAVAGTPWDDLVAWTLDRGLSGLEALSGIPGTVGAAPVQNIGAYGRDVAATLVSVRTWDRALEQVAVVSAQDLGLGYRTSAIKRSILEPGSELAGGRAWGPTGRWVVLEATFALSESGMSAPVRYAELADHLGVGIGDRAPASAVREAVLALRRSKGMVLDPSDHDTWSAGSFFTNPILPVGVADALLPPGAPRFAAGAGLVKTSAAWLIDHAGFGRGFALPGSGDEAGPRASLSTKHVLALTNRGRATSADIEALARAVRAGVREAFGVDLAPEPVTVGISL